MSRPRRAASADPQVLARLAAVAGGRGWVPPAGGPPPLPAPAASGPPPTEPPQGAPPAPAPPAGGSGPHGSSRTPFGTATEGAGHLRAPDRTEPDLRPATRRRRARHAPAQRLAAHDGDLPVPHLAAVDPDAGGPGPSASAHHEEDQARADPFDAGPGWASSIRWDREEEGLDANHEWLHRRDGRAGAGDGPEPAADAATASGAAGDDGRRSARSGHRRGSTSSRTQPPPDGARRPSLAQEDEAAGRSSRAAPAEEYGEQPPRPAASNRPPAPLLDRWRSARLDPGRRGIAALTLVALLAVALSAVVVLRARPHAVVAPSVVVPGVPVPGGLPVPGSTAGPGGAAGPGSAARGGAAARSASPGPVPATSPAELVVAVTGKVLRPGLVRLPPGSRVDDAIRAAGGPLPATDLTTVNLARVLVDGEQVLVGVPQTAAAAPTAGAAGAAPAGAGAGPAAGPVDLNAATVPQLDALPGIGPVLAQKIVDWRSEHGRFGSVDQLREVSGIGESKYAELAPKVRV